MGTMAHRVLLTALVGAVLTVAACGSDDGSSESSQAGATGTAGTTAPSQSNSEKAGGSAAERERGSSGSGSVGGGSSGSDRSPGSDGSSGGDGSSGSGGSKDRPNEGGSGQPGFSAPGLSPGPAGEGTPDDAPPLARTDSAARRLAREICAHVTLEGIALNLQISLKQRDAKFVARAFSRQFPKEHRDAAYEGCLDGFRNEVKRR